MKKSTEYENFDTALRLILKASHIENSKVIHLEGVDLRELSTPEGRRRSEQTFARNARKLRPCIVRGEIE